MTGSRIYDISEPISPATAVWPGDTPFSQDWVMRIQDGQSCNVSTIHLSVHCGTHTDAPYHFLEDGATIDEIPLATYVGPCRVIAVTPGGVPPVVGAELLRGPALEGCERALFRTRATHDATRFDEEFCSLGPAAAHLAVELGLRLIGLDTPSMDHFASKSLETHKILLRGGVAILENLDLSRVPPGDYELIALPLKIRGADSSPVRAILRSQD